MNAKTGDRVVAPMLEDKTVLVTGAARGLGAAIGRVCADHGARVVLVDILGPQLEATARAIGATAYESDVGDPAGWHRLESQLLAADVVPDVLVNNAGILRPEYLEHASFEVLEQVLRVNVGGTFLGMQTFVKMRAARQVARPGSIINISSVRGLVGGARLAAYSASKFGVRGLTKTAAVELGPLGIRVNSVCPGPIESDMTIGNPEMDDLDWDAYARNLPLGRLGKPHEIGEAVAWLGSDLSSFVTGIDLPVDAGLTATSYGVTSGTT